MEFQSSILVLLLKKSVGLINYNDFLNQVDKLTQVFSTFINEHELANDKLYGQRN